jgi:hypothetical protein
MVVVVNSDCLFLSIAQQEDFASKITTTTTTTSPGCDFTCLPSFIS